MVERRAGMVQEPGQRRVTTAGLAVRRAHARRRGCVRVANGTTAESGKSMTNGEWRRVEGGVTARGAVALLVAYLVMPFAVAIVFASLGVGYLRGDGYWAAAASLAGVMAAVVYVWQRLTRASLFASRAEWPSMTLVALAVLGGVLTSLALGYALRWLHLRPPVGFASPASAAGWLLAAFAFVTTAVVRELVFRGALLPATRRGLATPAAVAVVGVLDAGAMVTAGWPPSWFLLHLVYGCVAGAVAASSGSVLCAVAFAVGAYGMGFIFLW